LWTVVANLRTAFRAASWRVASFEPFALLTRAGTGALFAVTGVVAEEFSMGKGRVEAGGPATCGSCPGATGGPDDCCAGAMAGDRGKITPVCTSPRPVSPITSNAAPTLTITVRFANSRPPCRRIDNPVLGGGGGPPPPPGG
jgi:hypothetical protein